MNKLTAFVAMLIVCASARASLWVGVTQEATTGGKVDIDYESMSTSGIYKKAWFRTVYETSQKVTGIPQVVFYTTLKTLVYFDCKERKAAQLQMLFYGDDNSLQYSATIPLKDADFSEVSPDSIGEAELQAVCAARKPPT